MSTEYFKGFGTVSVDNEDIKNLRNGQVEVTFTVRSTDPAALDIVAKVAAGMSGASYICKDRQKAIVQLRAWVNHPEDFTAIDPFFKDFFEALKTKVNGVDRSRFRRAGVRII